MMLIWFCRYSRTSFERWRPMAVNPRRVRYAPNAAGSGAAYSTNSKPRMRAPSGAVPMIDSAERSAREASDSTHAIAQRGDAMRHRETPVGDIPDKAAAGAHVRSQRRRRAAKVAPLHAFAAGIHGGPRRASRRRYA